MSGNAAMRLLVTRAGAPKGKYLDTNSLSVFLNVTIKDCYSHIYYGFCIDGDAHVLIDQQVYNYAPGVWILRNPTRRCRPPLAKSKKTKRPH